MEEPENNGFSPNWEKFFIDGEAVYENITLLYLNFSTKFTQKPG
jgi:hypothetical protein